MPSLTEWNGRESATPSVLERLLRVLDAVKAAGGPLSVSEIAAATDLPKSTASRLVADLAERGLLERQGEGITLGLRLFELGMRARVPRRIVAAAAPVVRRLRELTGQRVGVWINQGVDMVSLVTIAGSLPTLPTHSGMRAPALTTASGKAYLAFCRQTTVLDRISDRLVPDQIDRFQRELTHVRDDVCAVDEGVAYPGITAVGTPVFGADDLVVGAVSIAGPQDTTDAARLIPLVREAGITVSRRLVAA